MRRGGWYKVGLHGAAVTLSAMAVVAGCRGEEDRSYFDDGPDSATPDGTTAPDAPSSAVDGTSPVPDGALEASADADASTDGPSDADAADAIVSHKVGGTVLGLTGSGLVLQLNGGSDLPVSASGGGNVPFTFGSQVNEGAGFTVSVKTPPSGPTQVCSVSGGSGTMGIADVTAVIVNCDANSFTIGGNVTGVEGSVTLQNQGANDLVVTANGSFAFPTPVADLSPYAVSVSGHSALPVQTCNVSSGSGNVAGANVNSVAVSCTTTGYTLGGTASGITGTVQIKNGNDLRSITGNGPFTFGQSVLSNRTYDVELVSSPPGTTCKIGKPSGTVTNANVSDVTVTCFPQYALNEKFDSVVAPTLPANWSTAILLKTGGPTPFATTAAASPSGTLSGSDTAPNSCAIGEHNNISDIVLTSPTFTVASDSATLSFRHTFALEGSATAGSTTGYDGVALEISIGGGPFTDIITAGGTWVTGGYNRFLYNDWNNPLGTISILAGLPGRACWSGMSAGWITTTVKLPLTTGQSAQIRFREGTDKQNVVCGSPPYCEGWRVDTLTVAN